MATKIQINSLAALERLIGNETEIEMDIRQSVVEAFTKKHLKSLVNDEVLSRIKGEILSDLRKEFIRPQAKGYWKTVEIFNSDTKSDMLSDLRCQASIELRKLVTDALNEYQSKEKIKEAIDNGCMRIEHELTDEIVATRIYNAAQEKINAAINAINGK